MVPAVEVLLDALILKGYVSATKNDEGEEVYRLTEDGKKYAAEQAAKRAA